MRTVLAVTALSLSVVVTGLLIGCDKGPTRPGPAPSPVADLSPIRLEIGGPRDVPPDERAQFTATVQFSDGSKSEVTGEASWHSSNSSVLSISGAGLAAGHRRGETNISAVFKDTSSAKEVIVVPAGTFRLTGLVTEAGSPSNPVRDAQVEVTTAGGATVSTATDNDGRYRQYGVSDGAQIRVTKEGYQPHLQSVRISDHGTLDVELSFTPRADLSGTYILTITAAVECRSTLPEEARTRTYTAIVRQAGSRLAVTLQGASFFVSPLPVDRTKNTFVGAFEADRPTFVLNDFSDNDYADIIEQLTPSLFFVPSGTVVATLSTAGISGRLNGHIGAWQPAGDSGFGRIAGCRSSDHQFLLGR